MFPRGEICFTRFSGELEGQDSHGFAITPPKTIMDTQNDAMFERRYIFQTIIFGIYVKFRGCNPIVVF